MTLERMALAARLLLGSIYLISGLAWFFGFMPLPSMDMSPDFPIKHQVVREMIETGWMFQSAKVIEIAAGIALLSNRFVPAMLAVSAPVAFITFMMDAMILDDVIAWFRDAASTEHLLAKLYDMVVGGLCVLLAHVWLMLCYFEHYRPMLIWSTKPQTLGAVSGTRHLARRDNLRVGFYALGGIALALLAWNFYLFVGLIGR
jgi:hypothetical protein